LQLEQADGRLLLADLNVFCVRPFGQLGNASPPEMAYIQLRLSPGPIITTVHRNWPTTAC
jgi:hypothetical protein